MVLGHGNFLSGYGVEGSHDSFIKGRAPLEEYAPADPPGTHHPVEVVMHDRIAQPRHQVPDRHVLLLVADHI